MIAMELILARHGEPACNTEEWLAQDCPLTELGRKQAERLGKWLASNYCVTAFYASPMQRARETAEIVNRELGLNIIFDEDLQEADPSYRTAMPTQKSPFSPSQYDGKGCKAIYEEFRQRVKKVVKKIITTNPNGTVLIVAHAGTLGTMIRCLLGLHTVSIDMDYTGVHHLVWRDKRWEIRYINRREHLISL